MPSIDAVLLSLHVLAAAFWVGGMATMHFAVRPAAVATLEAPLRLTFVSNVLGRFFNGVTAAIGVLLVTGFAMIALAAGAGRLHWRIHAMLALGLLMMALFGHIRLGVYPALQRAVAAREFPRAAAKLDSIRKLVAVNLLLGVLLFAIVLVGRAF